MSSFFNMYIDFTSRNLNEYHKICKVFEDATTPEHYEVAKEMVTQFACNCDKRRELLTRRAIWHFYCPSYWKERKAYHRATLIQLQDLIELSNEWTAQYEQWSISNKLQEEEKEKKRKSKRTVTGFQTLNKVTKVKKSRSKKKGAK